MSQIRIRYVILFVECFTFIDINSGDPVYAYYDSTGYTAIGILTSDSEDTTFGESYPDAYSTVTRITEDLFNLFVHYR